MSNEIKVGGYVRTDKGEIVRVTSVAKETLGEILGANEYRSIGLCNTEPYVYGNIVKHSKQLINVLEEGDMIITRENRIYKLDSVIKGELYCDYYKYHDTLISINIDEVSMILTKEQYMANCYKVGGE